MIDYYYGKKIALGTVQFGLNYGISNVLGKTKESEVAKILETAWEKGIDTIDTARDYGNSENILGKQLRHPFRIITKFPTRADTPQKIEQSLFDSIKDLNTRSVYAFMAHDADLLIKAPELWQVLTSLKEKKLVEKIGYSLYTPVQLQHLIDLKIIPDIVQLPYNFLDQRFKSFFHKLKSIGIEIHIRSVFLQGLFFMKPNNLSTYFESVKPILKDLQLAFPDMNDLAGWLMQFVLKEKNIDKVVIGVNNQHQLELNLSNLLRDYSIQPSFFNKDIPERVLIPNYWPKD